MVWDGSGWAGRDPQRSPGPTRQQGAGPSQVEEVLRAPSRLSWEVSRAGARPTSVGNVLQRFACRLVAACCLPCTEREPPLVWFEASPRCGVAAGPLTKSSAIFLVSPLEVLKGGSKVSAGPSLLQAEEAHLSEPFLAGEALQGSDGVCGPAVDALQEVRGLPVARPPELRISWWKAGRGVGTVEETGRHGGSGDAGC